MPRKDVKKSHNKESRLKERDRIAPSKRILPAEDYTREYSARVPADQPGLVIELLFKGTVKTEIDLIIGTGDKPKTQKYELPLRSNPARQGEACGFPTII